MDAAPKQFITLAGKPILIHGLEVFERLDYVATKYIVCGRDQGDSTAEVLRTYGISNWVLVEGGDSRADSVRNGLQRVRTRRVLTHNAVVALVTQDLVDRVVAEDYDGVTMATALEYNLCEGEEFAERIVPRKHLKLINTPQCFRTDVFRECHDRARREGYVPASDTELLLHYGRTVRLVPGPDWNFKITTPLDLAVAEMILTLRRTAGSAKATDRPCWRDALSRTA